MMYIHGYSATAQQPGAGQKAHLPDAPSLRGLQPGDTISAKVLSDDGETLTLRTGDGVRFTARSEGRGIPVGQSIELIVRTSSEEGVTAEISAVKQLDLRAMLRSFGVQPARAELRLAAEMAAQKMPMNEQNFSAARRLMGQFKALSAEQAVFMLNNKIPVTPQSIRQFQGFLEHRTQLGAALAGLLELLDGEPPPAARADASPEGEGGLPAETADTPHREEAAPARGNAHPAGGADAQARGLPERTGAPERMPAAGGPEGRSEAAAGRAEARETPPHERPSPQANTRSDDAGPAARAERSPQPEPPRADLPRAQSAAEAEPGGPAYSGKDVRPAGAESSAPAHRGTPAHAETPGAQPGDTPAQPEAAVAQTGEPPARMGTAAARRDPPAQSGAAAPQPGDAPEQSKNAAATSGALPAQQEVTVAKPGDPPAPPERAVAGPEAGPSGHAPGADPLRTMLRDLYKKVDAQRGDRLARELEAPALKRELAKFVSEFESRSGRYTEATGRAVRGALRDMEQSLKFMEQVNNFTAYVQIPLHIGGADTTAELYVFNDSREKRKIDPENATLFLSLGTAGIGRVEVFVKVVGNQVECDFGLENRELPAFFSGHMQELSALLEAAGYRLTRAAAAFAEQPADVIEIAKRRPEVSQRYTLDRSI